MSTSNQAAAMTFSTSDHYTAETGRMSEGREGWKYSGTLYRNGAEIATFDERGDGGMMRVTFSDDAEEAALRDWYHRVADASGHYEAGFAIEVIVGRSNAEAYLRKTMLKTVLWCKPGDVRNGGESPFYTTKPAGRADVMTWANRFQQECPEFVVLNLLPFDAAFALYTTLTAA